MAMTEFTMALQLEDQDATQKALAFLKEAGIVGDAVPVATTATASLPAWANPASGGWFLRIREDQFLEGMKALETFMGYSPD